MLPYVRAINDRSHALKLFYFEIVFRYGDPFIAKVMQRQNFFNEKIP
jgi:hypothetical protein